MWLARHAQRTSYKELDCHISEEGKKYAQKKSQELKDQKIKTIYCSPFKRTIETAQIFKANLPSNPEIIIDPLLSEGLQPFIMKDPVFEPDLQKQLDEANIKYPEHTRQIKDRCKLFLSKLKDESGVLIITHGVIYNTFLRIFFPKHKFSVTPENYSPYYCDLTQVEKVGDKWLLKSTDIKHLQRLLKQKVKVV
jgi:broad specificity phosphatase PhoE